METAEHVLRDILTRRDPHGYYVIPVDIEKLDEVMRNVSGEGIKIVYMNELALIKTRSRAMASRIARTAARVNALVIEL